MKSIIVPVDFSDQSEKALKIAAGLARANKAELLVLHMLEISPAIISRGEEYVPQVQMVHLIKAIEDRMSAFLDKPYLSGVHLTPVIKHYKVFSEVNDLAEKHNADLIIMGSHGTDGLDEICLGSNTERVIRNSSIPVLVVKGEHPEEYKIERFVFACDFREESIAAVKRAKDFAKALGATLKLVYVNTPGDGFLSTPEAYQQINDFLAKASLGLEVEVFNDYTVERGVLNFAESYGAHLIGIPTHGRKGLSHVFMGSIGEDVANHSGIPVITFRI